MDDSSAPATKGDLAAFATKADLAAFATKADLAALAAATKGDIAAQSAEMKTDLQTLEQNIMKAMDEQSKRAQEDSDRILDVVVNMDKRLTTKVKEHEKRISVLEGAMAA